MNRFSLICECEPIAALLYEPQGNARSAAVVVSPSRGTTIEKMDWLASPLAAAGFAVLVQGYRPGAVRYQLRDVTDVREAVSWLMERAQGSECRIATIGHSRGGSAALRAAAHDVRVQSTVALCPPIDIARYMNGLRMHSPSRFETLVAGYGASPQEDPSYFAKISPLTYAARITTPVLLVHGAYDMIAPKENSEWMLAALIRSGNACARMEVIEGAGHFFEERFGGYRFAEVLRLILPWLDETLG